ncbi:MAG: endolytic transglycosylase MltG [Gemmatimonadales bacterium]
MTIAPRAAAIVAGWVAACGTPTQGPAAADSVLVVIPRGASFEAAVDSLAARGVVRHPGPFRLFARLRGLPGSLKSGVYAFPPNEEWGRVVATLARGRGAEVRFTVPEGLMLVEVAELARRQLGLAPESVLAAARRPERLAELGLATALPAPTSVEGYLYPSTYLLPVGIDATDLVRVMTQTFTGHWSPEWQARLDTLGMTRHQVVTLASIIQSEMRYQPDAPFISAVYHNRGRRRMPLQADPTGMYALQQRVSRVLERHLQVRSPYNTYLHRGLPPGPISQPGVRALEAALYPAPVPFLYFVARPDGKHVFSVTYAEHQAAIRVIRRGQSAVPAPRPRGR